MRQAPYWKKIYTEIYAMEERVVACVRQLMEAHSEVARREVEREHASPGGQAERF
jgi:hypothetical protein